MSDNREEVRFGKLVCDAVPDPPRDSNTFDDQNISHNQTSEKLPSEDDITSSKPSKVKYVKSKKKTKTTTTTPTTNNYNFLNCSNITIGSTTKFVYNNLNEKSPAAAEEKEDRPPALSPQAQTLINIGSKISKDDIEIIKSYIGKGWKNFAKGIGYSKGQIDQFLINHESKGIGEVVYKILIDWKQNCTSSATISRAVLALWSSKEYDCIDKLAVARNLF